MTDDLDLWPGQVSPGGDDVGPEDLLKPDPVVFPETEPFPGAEVPADINGFWIPVEGTDALIAAFDVDGDAGVDVVFFDLDGDGNPEAGVAEQDGQYLVRLDEDGDGVFESERVLTREELAAAYPQALELLDAQFGADSPGFDDPGARSPAAGDGGEHGIEDILPAGQPVGPVEPVEGEPLVVDGQLVGDPEGASEHWFQQAANGFCVPASVAQIVSEYTGVHYDDEQAFVTRANELHLFTVDPEGVPTMTIEGAATLLKDAGVPVGIYPPPDLVVGDLVEYVADGHQILLAVDAHELWKDAPDAAGANHALVLTGFDLEAGVAILSDPGTSFGDEYEVPISELENAWADSDHSAIVCDVPPSEMPGAVEPTLGEGGPIPSTLPDLDQHNNAVVDWLLDHPWVVIPVMFGVGAIVRRDKGK